MPAEREAEARVVIRYILPLGRGAQPRCAGFFVKNVHGGKSLRAGGGPLCLARWAGGAARGAGAGERAQLLAVQPPPPGELLHRAPGPTRRDPLARLLG